MGRVISMQTFRGARAESITLYHGTAASRVPGIRSSGLTPPPGKGSMNGWYMLTTSLDQALRYAMGDEAVAIEYQIPLSRIFRATEYGPGDLLWPGEPHDTYGFEAVAYAPRVPIPGSMIVRVHEASRKTAMPSWRGLVNGPIWDEYPGVILVDKTGGGRQSYEVYVFGRQIGRGRTLDDAKAMIETKIGPCEFRRVRQDPIKTEHMTFGIQDWFGDPSITYAAIPVS
jgi:hypothetical protein